MAIDAAYFGELVDLYPGAQSLTEGGQFYIHIPEYKLPNDATVEVLLLLNGAAPYTTRLFLPKQIDGKGANWSQHQILNKTWWTWSWKDIPSDMRYVEILANHVKALR